MSVKHTRGPWQALPPRIGAAITIYAADGQTPVATTCSNTAPATMEMHRRGEVKANAALIAASPELLDELRVARAALADFAGLTEAHAHALARRFAESIAKATGGMS